MMKLVIQLFLVATSFAAGFGYASFRGQEKILSAAVEIDGGGRSQFLDYDSDNKYANPADAQFYSGIAAKKLSTLKLNDEVDAQSQSAVDAYRALVSETAQALFLQDQTYHLMSREAGAFFFLKETDIIDQTLEYVDSANPKIRGKALTILGDYIVRNENAFDQFVSSAYREHDIDNIESILSSVRGVSPVLTKAQKAEVAVLVSDIVARTTGEAKTFAEDTSLLVSADIDKVRKVITKKISQGASQERKNAMRLMLNMDPHLLDPQIVEHLYKIVSDKNENAEIREKAMSVLAVVAYEKSINE